MTETIEPSPLRDDIRLLSPDTSIDFDDLFTEDGGYLEDTGDGWSTRMYFSDFTLEKVPKWVRQLLDTGQLKPGQWTRVSEVRNVPLKWDGSWKANIAKVAREHLDTNATEYSPFLLMGLKSEGIDAINNIRLRLGGPEATEAELLVEAIRCSEDNIQTISVYVTLRPEEGWSIPPLEPIGMENWNDRVLKLVMASVIIAILTLIGTAVLRQQ